MIVAAVTCVTVIHDHYMTIIGVAGTGGGIEMNRIVTSGVAAAFLGCISFIALADAADQATLKVYRLGAPGRALRLTDLTEDALVLQQAETIALDENAPIEQSFSLEGTRYSYTVSYASGSDYERSAVKLMVVDDGSAKLHAQSTVDNVMLTAGKTTMVNVGGYVLAFTMDPPI
jgi:hypothetical protein